MGKSDETTWSGVAGPMGAIIERQIASALAAEEDAIEGVRHLVDRWCDRRHRMVAAYSAFAATAMRARDPQELATAWLELTRGAVERLGEDARDQIEAAAGFTRKLAGAQMFPMPLAGAGFPALPAMIPATGRTRTRH